MTTSSIKTITRRRSAPAAIASVGLALVLAGCGASSTPAPTDPPARVASGAAQSAAAVRPAAVLSRLVAGPAPAGWIGATIASGAATMFYPADWNAVRGDRGTVTAVLRDATGAYGGYLNVTPDQGAEPESNGWAAFRTGRNRKEGDRRVRRLAAADRLGFRQARGSCVIDDYLSRVGAHPYREIACIVTGARHTSVLVAAAMTPDWPTVAPILERAASAFLQR